MQISRGNFYYHFKSKDEILDAVIALRLVNTQRMLDRWEQDAASPLERLRQFIDMLIVNQAPILRYGCPVGTLCTELAKLNHAGKEQANALFTLFRSWLKRQFVALGRKSDADALAMHLLGRSQGIATLANALGDKRFLRREVQQLHAWLEQVVTIPSDRERTTET